MPSRAPTSFPSFDCPAGYYLFGVTFFPDGAAFAGVVSSIYTGTWIKSDGPGADNVEVKSLSGVHPDKDYSCIPTGCYTVEFDIVAATELEVMVVVLAVVGVSNHTDLSPATARPIAHVLMNFLRTGSPERAAFAADMLGKGFVLWRPYLDGSLQVRSLNCRDLFDQKQNKSRRCAARRRSPPRRPRPAPRGARLAPALRR